ncbi:MAG TPA: amino acid adenylation domain-containing protein, partial [Chitinophaga sp.]|nr:amino acid adenylation domain-containing protein [Chitinophaga sp.]
MNKRIIHTVFEDVASGLSSKVAIEAGDDRITYGELNTLANRLSHLLTYLNYGPEKIVNVVMPPSIHLVGAMLAVFKSGSIFLPVDLGFSEKRLRQIFRDTFDGVVIVTADVKDRMLEIAAVLDISITHLIVVNADDSLLLYTGGEEGLMPELFDEEDTWGINPPLIISGDSAAYIYYTSGSTGDGKAILGAHASLSHFIHWEIREFGFDHSGRFSQLAQITFDASLRDIFVALISGGTLCIPPANVKANTAQLLNWLTTSAVNTVHCVPSLFRVLTKELEAVPENTYDLSKLTHVLMAGELIFAKDIHNWRRVAGNNTCLVNLYGPTETTMIKTFYRIQEVPASPSYAIPVGVPISNTVVAIIRDGRICRTGEKGEIYIKTPFATKGYYKNEQLTSECFVQNPLVSDEIDIVYRTGDLGRYLPDGNIEVLGRMDTQVKVNGIRVELAEIERALLDLPQITGAVVKLHSTAEHFSMLVAYYTGAELDAEQLRKELEKTLNPQLMPSCFIYMQAFPLNINGKVDKKSLPLPEEVIMGGPAFEAPVGEMENTLAASWREVLGYAKVGRNISFFNAGGNSLRAIQLISRIEKAYGVSLSIADIFTYPTIAEMAAFIANGFEMEFRDIPIVAEQPHYPLSTSQRRLWMLSQLGEANVAYNMSGVYTFEGKLKAAALNHAFEKLVQRHESLRTVFREDDVAGVRQFILPAEKAGTRMVIKDVRQEGELLPCLLYQVTGRPFDLAAGPLVRAALYRVTDDKWIFAYGMHHIISDGWSMNVLINELLTFYKAHMANVSYPLPPLRIQYKDYAAWQQEQLSGASLEGHRTYWLQQFAGELPVLELTTDRPRPAVKTYNGGVIHKRISKELTMGLQELVQQEGATLFMGLLAAVNALLHRYTGQEDIIIGSPIAGRGHIDLEDQIGFYVNTLALRTRFSGKDSYRELLLHIRDITLGAYEHQVYPFDELVNDLNLPRDMSRSALFDVMIVLQDARSGKRNDQFLEDVRVSEYTGGESHASKFDLNFRFSETNDGLQLNIVYNSDLYDAETVVRMGDHLEELLRTVVADAGCPVQELDYIGVEEEHQLLEVFNNMDAAPVSDKTFVTLFEEQAALYPDRKAVQCEGESLSYRELNERANRLAYYLRNEQRIGADSLVGILLDRSADMIVGILGVLKSGGAYVPIDPDYPRQRINFLLKDTAVGVLLTNSGYSSLAADYNGTLFEMDRQLEELPDITGNPAFDIAGRDLAYVIYTSGSTGQPKGVMISHGSLTDYCLGVLSKTNISECRHFGLLSTIAADLGNTVLYPALLVGGTLHIFPGTSQLDVAGMRRAELDCIKIVPSHWKALSDEAGCFVPARCLIFGGESLTEDVLLQIRSVNSTCRVYNHYGPTETTVGKLIHEVRPEERIPLGAPFGCTEVYILDKQDQLCGIGIPGEICISGAGVARGYLRNPMLTAEKFVVNPFREGERMYRTGDLGRWLPDGRIAYLGRKDDQVKLRGYRIELGEIARSLENHAMIRSAVAVVRTNGAGEQELVAYFTGDADLQVSELRGWLSRSLPSYMLPHHYVQLDAIPLTANGKVDRKQLPAPEGLAIDARVAYVAPRNETEEKLIKIWEEILGKEGIGIRDNFFELGGHSLKATRLVTHIHKVFEVRIPLRALFANEILEEQAQLIQQGKKTSFTSIAPVRKQAFYPLSATQRRLWLLGQFDENNVAFNMLRVYVFEGKLDMASLQSSFDMLIARHESLRTVFCEDERGEVGQVILQPEEIGFSIEYVDISGEKEQEATLRKLIATATASPFDLASGPLVRATVYQVAADKWVFYYGMHHIVSDGWSMSVLLKELLLSYNAAVSGNAVATTPLRIQYKDYAVWQQEQLNGTALQMHREYWLKRFEGELPVLTLPVDGSRPAVKTYNGGAVHKVISKELTGSLKQLLQQEGCTLFMGLLAVVKALLHRYSQQEDIIVGSPVAGRDHIELENQIGFYINPLALRTQFSTADSYLELLRKVKQVTLDGYEHQMYPFDELVDELNPLRDMSRSPLFDVMVILQNHDSVSFRQQQDLTDLRVSEYKGEGHEVSKFDLSFYFVENNGEIRAKIEYNSDLFNSA